MEICICVLSLSPLLWLAGLCTDVQRDIPIKLCSGNICTSYFDWT